MASKMSTVQQVILTVRKCTPDYFRTAISQYVMLLVLFIGIANENSVSIQHLTQRGANLVVDFIIYIRVAPKHFTEKALF